MEAWHLTKRFFGSVMPREPSAAEEAWLVAMLSSGEESLYRCQPALDRCHSIDCALAVRSALGTRATRQVMVAAALHDVGKAEAGLGVAGRVVATVLGLGLSPERLEQWGGVDGLRGQVSRYVCHDVRGAELLMQVGSDPMVVAWAREHHEPADACSIDAEIADVLRRSDG